MQAREYYRSAAQQSISVRGILMKPDGYYTGVVDRLSIRCRRWSRPLRATAITLLLLLLSIPGNPASAAPGSDAHVYLLRGVLNIFSLGLDDIGAKLQQQGINATVANYLSWESLADEAAAEYRSGRIKTVVLVGHSSGATVLPDMVARLNRLGVPVSLAIGLDSVFQPSLSGHVGRYLNFYVANGGGTQVGRTNQFHGNLENVDVGGMGVGHLSIDKSEAMQRKVIAAIDSAVLSHPRGTSATQRRLEPGASKQSSAAPVRAPTTSQ